MSGAGTRRQRERGIADDGRTHFDDVMRISRGTCHAGLVEFATQIGGSTIDWLDDAGFDFDPVTPAILHFHEAYRIARTYWGRDGGRSVLKAVVPLFEAAMRQPHATLHLRTEVEALLQAADGAVTGLLVQTHVLHVALAGETRPGDGQAGASDQCLDTCHVRRGQMPQFPGQVGRHHHAGADGFAVQPVAIAQAGFDSVAEGMAKIEQCAHIHFAFILGHDGRFDFAGAHYGMFQGSGIACKQRIDVGFQPLEERCIADEPMLDDFGQAGP